MQKVKLRRILENCLEFLLVVTCRTRVSESLFVSFDDDRNSTRKWYRLFFGFPFSGFSLQNFPFLKSVLGFAVVAFGSRIEFDIYVCVVHVTHI